MKRILTILLVMLGLIMTAQAYENKNDDMIIRISEIEVYPEYLDEYLRFAQEVAKDSIEKEDGVISIYPMMVIKNNNQIRILEIYKNEEAYKNHIASAHFQKYKQGTLSMVKSLNLVDTYQLVPENFSKIFKR